MTKNDIIKYVMDTPDNTNPSVLNSMLESLDSSDSSSIVLEPLTNGAAAGDILEGKEAYSDKGTTIVGTFVAPASGAKVYTITGTDTNNSQVPADFPVSFSMNAVENGDMGIILILHEEYQRDETSDLRETTQIHSFTEIDELTLEFVFGQSYKDNNNLLGRRSTMSWDRDSGTCSLSNWQDGYIEDGDFGSYSYYDYLQGDTFVYDGAEGESYYSDRHTAEMEGYQLELYIHSITWKLIIFDNRSE